MSEAKRLGEFLPAILARTERMMVLQDILNTLTTDAARKVTIMMLHEIGRLDGDEASLLITANMLEEV